MLYSTDTMRYVKAGYVPHAHDYGIWRARLEPASLQAIKDELNRKVDGGEIHVSSWMPGNDWKDTVYMPLYEATFYNEEMAALFFGLVLWETLGEREDVWAFVKWEPSFKAADKARGMVYWKLDPPPRTE
jgi:hypothetical protein